MAPIVHNADSRLNDLQNVAATTTFPNAYIRLCSLNLTLSPLTTLAELMAGEITYIGNVLVGITFASQGWLDDDEVYCLFHAEVTANPATDLDTAYIWFITDDPATVLYGCGYFPDTPFVPGGPNPTAASLTLAMSLQRGFMSAVR